MQAGNAAETAGMDGGMRRQFTERFGQIQREFDKAFKELFGGGKGTLERVWGYDYMGETNVVDVYVYYLRNKIDDVFGEKIIHTVRGIGYVIKD